MFTRRLVAAIGVCVLVFTATAQDLYDTTVLRTLNFQFHDANWLTLLRSNYVSQTNILADLTVEGVTYPNVGVRIRGNTSYTALPSGSEKFSLNVELDAVDPEQNLLGYDALNLNNGFHDPTFCREVLYNNFVAQYIPNPRANHVVVTLNGQNWGVYINVQQFDKTMLSRHFPDTNGLRIKCANNPNGPGLRYNGALPSGYTGYEIKSDGGLADPWAAHIAVCNAVTNFSLANLPAIDAIFAIDPSIWSVVIENALTDDDSYINKGADFMTYRNPTDSRTFLLQTDANETFTQTNWAITRNFTQSTKPVLNRVLSVAELRQRYMAHYRTVKADITRSYFEPRALALRDLISDAVAADPKKLYSHTLFLNNFNSTVTLPYGGLAGGTIVGLLQFVDQRATFLNSNAELAATGPTISSVSASDASPDPTDPVSISATVTAAGNPILRVELFYRPTSTAGYSRVQMTTSGGNLYAAPLPITATPGQRVDYYVAATASNANQSVSFFPARTEWAPLRVTYNFGASGGMRITEWMYSGGSGEFVELTNVSDEPVDLSGWSIDDDHAVSGAFDISSAGIVQPGESVVITEADASAFRTAWGLAASVPVVGGLGVSSGNNFARNDEINVYNAAEVLMDRLTYGDQTFTGTIRTQNASGQTCLETIGQNTVAGWVRSTVGDAYGSYAASSGDVGTPGSYAGFSCNPCAAPAIGTQPSSSVNTCLGEIASFSVIASGSGPLVYQWQVETGAPGSGDYVDLAEGVVAGVGFVAGSGTAGMSITQLVPGATATVRCVVTNACGEEASTPATLSACSLVADIDCSHEVNLTDLATLLANFGRDDEPDRSFGNIDGDGDVDLTDLAMLLVEFGLTCP